jgi:hypothetical protein
MLILAVMLIIEKCSTLDKITTYGSRDHYQKMVDRRQLATVN